MNPEIVPLHLCFKGSRDYLHGTDIYEALAGLTSTNMGGAIDHLQMSIHRFFSFEPDIYWLAGARAPARPGKAVVDFAVSGNGKSAVGWLVETDRQVVCRVPYDEERIARHSAFQQDAISASGDAGCLPIEVTVSMTKHLHINKLRVPHGRWVFTKLDLRRLFRDSDAAAITITLKENLYNRLTKSEIKVHGEAIGHIFFSLARA